jgi:hypothetical protein
MRREPEHFEDQDLSLIYIAKRLNDALRLETLLTDAGVDFLVEPDRYMGGIIFQAERVGAFFYVAPADAAAAKETLSRSGFKPHMEE